MNLVSPFKPTNCLGIKYFHCLCTIQMIKNTNKFVDKELNCDKRCRLVEYSVVDSCSWAGELCPSKNCILKEKNWRRYTSYKVPTFTRKIDYLTEMIAD